MAFLRPSFSCSFSSKPKLSLAGFVRQPVGNYRLSRLADWHIMAKSPSHATSAAAKPFSVG